MLRFIRLRDWIKRNPKRKLLKGTHFPVGCQDGQLYFNTTEGKFFKWYRFKDSYVQGYWKEFKELPDSYVDCIIKHKDGGMRIGRLNHNKTYWQISSYQIRKVEVLWSVDEVQAFKVIDYEDKEL